MKNKRVSLAAISVLLCFILASSFSGLGAASLIEPNTSDAGGILVTGPEIPLFNVFAPSNIVWMTGFQSLADYNMMTGQMLPVLASNWTLDPSNLTMTVYLRKGLYWYNGSATMPFTAWDVYTFFYIANKGFMYYTPFLAQNSTGIHVINNYTIQFKFTQWSMQNVIYMLTATISMPYSVWKPYINMMKGMNDTEAVSFAASNLTKFVVPWWFLGPYYVTKVSEPVIQFHLDPPNLLQAWDQIFPYHSWQYYAPTFTEYVGSNTQVLDWFMAKDDTYAQGGFSVAQANMMVSSGFQDFWFPTLSPWGITINQTHYPWNIPAVRQAVAYAINRTAVASVWGLGKAAYPQDIAIPFAESVFPYLPQSIRSMAINYSYNPAKAASILEGLGFAIQAPAGYTDWTTMAEAAANSLTEFGIPASVYADSVSTYWGTIVPQVEYQAALGVLGSCQSWLGAWAGIEGYPSFKPTAIWTFQYPNGTTGHINLTQWNTELLASAPGSPQYDALMTEYSAFSQYWLPVIPLVSEGFPVIYIPQDYNVSWMLKLPMNVWYSLGAWSILGPLATSQVFPAPALFLAGLTPPGVESPLAEAIATHSVIPSYAAFIGLNSTYSENYYASLAKAALSTSTISLAVSPTSTTAGTPVTLTATLTYANGTPASGIGVTFTSDGTAIGTATTSSTGVATLSYTPTTAGTYSLAAYVTAVPSVSSTTSLSVASTTVTTPVPVVYPSLTLSVSPTSVTAGTPVTLTATATFPNGTAASGYSVGFFANGAGIGTATTSSSGTATLSYTPTSAGTYTLTADLTSHTSTTSSPTTLTVTAKAVTPTPTPTNYALYYGIAALVVIVIVVVAVVLALSRRGKKGPSQQK